LVLLLFSLNNAVNAFLWISLAAISEVTGLAFGVSTTSVNYFSLVFLIVYLPATLVVSFCIDRFGTRMTFIGGSFLNCVGGWLRYIGLVSNLGGSNGFALSLVGQILAALGQPVFTNLPARISSDWFSVKERDTATVIASLSNAIGTAVASVVPSLVVSTAQDLPSLLLGTAIATSVIFLGSALGMTSDVPSSPPSASASIRQLAALRRVSTEELLLPNATGSAIVDDRSANTVSLTSPQAHPRSGVSLVSTMRSVLRQYWSLVCDKNFGCLLWGFGIGLGLFNALLTLIAQIILPCGYGADAAGLAGGALLGTGLVVAGGVGVLLEKTRAYTLILKVFMCLAGLALIFFLSSLRRNSYEVLIVSSAVMGGFLIPILPISLENAAECTYPLTEEVSSGLLLSLGNYVGLILAIAMQFVIPDAASPSSCNSPVTPLAGIILGSFSLAMLSIAFFRPDYKRQNAERGGDGEILT